MIVFLYHIDYIFCNMEKYLCIRIYTDTAAKVALGGTLITLTLHQGNACLTKHLSMIVLFTL
jgi:hypothetical protein